MNAPLEASLGNLGVCFETIPSRVSPDETCFLVCAPDWTMVDMALQDLLAEYPSATVLGPIMVPDGSWAVFGRVLK